MCSMLRATMAVAALTLAARTVAAQETHTMKAPTPADGYAIHVTAPHMYQNREIGPVHHFCKPITPDPIIVCLLYESMDADAPLQGVEYIVANTKTRPSVSLGTWNANFHDHTVEIAGGRVKVLDLPPEEAKKVADLVATTDGIIFHLWPMGDAFPTGTVAIDQAVGHRPLTPQEYAASMPATMPGN